MAHDVKTDILVIGAGSGGLSVAAGASQLGVDVTLLEGGEMGGDCLNYGCVPSKALLRAAKAAQEVRTSGQFGVNGHEPEIDFAKVKGHVKSVIAGIAPMDSVERFEGLGVRVIKEYGQFVDENTVSAGNYRIKAKKIVVATGSHAAVPPIPGLDEVTYFTNETIFEQLERPEHLIVIGAGPIGVEMGQAHRRLGSAVTIVDMGKIMPNDDPELVDVIRQKLIKEGVELKEQIAVERVEQSGNGIAVIITKDGVEERIEGTDLLIAAGRRPNVGKLNLEAAGITFDRRGITVDDRLRSSNRKVYAIGDVAGGPQFTHIAGYHAGVIIKNLLFKMPAKVDYTALPWVTYVEPELAHVGMSEKQAREQFGDGGFEIARWSFHENDRASAEAKGDGMVKVIIRKGRVYGASVVGPNAGEIIQLWCYAVQERVKLSKLASMIVPYPTLAEVNKRAAGSYFTPKLFSARTRKIVKFLQMFG
ncbi:MAG: FAD-dependent oxidoreductase [Alphaproteobacteria bacterium]|nr:FAD-dependent oxidoreductase [Alphaproteobacteria bacterium SS10]